MALAARMSAQEPAGSGGAPLIPKADVEALAVIVERAQAGNPAALRAASEKIAALPSERLLSAVAFALRGSGGKELLAALDRVGREASDRRVVPFLADCIERSDGKALLEAVWAAKRLPDKSYLPGLMDHAIESDYSEHYMEAGPRGTGRHQYVSVFHETAELLYVLSDGKIGLESARRDLVWPMVGRPDGEGRRIKEWVAWWEERKPVPPAPREDAKVMSVLSEVELARDADAKSAASTKLVALPRERVVGALFFALGQGKDKDRLTALRAIGSEVFDRRLVPLVADCLAKTAGEVLLESVRAAKRLPDERYMAALIEHCLTSDYYQEKKVSVDGADHVSYVSVFGAAGEVLFVLSRGHIGDARAYADTRYQGGSKVNQDKLAAEWRAWWEAQRR